MARQKDSEVNIRSITKVGSTSYAVTIPIGIVKSLGLRERQKMIVRREGKKIIIEEWGQ